jgi:hypothetical protein
LGLTGVRPSGRGGLYVKKSDKPIPRSFLPSTIFFCACIDLDSPVLTWIFLRWHRLEGEDGSASRPYLRVGDHRQNLICAPKPLAMRWAFSVSVQDFYFFPGGINRY